MGNIQAQTKAKSIKSALDARSEIAATVPVVEAAEIATASTKSAKDDELMRLTVEKCVADARLETATKKMKAEADAKALEPKQQASRAFSDAYHSWLTAKAGIEDYSLDDEEMDSRLTAQYAAERRLITMPAAWPDQVWQKLEAFEIFLNAELIGGVRRDSILMLALGSIKQDILNLELCGG